MASRQKSEFLTTPTIPCLFLPELTDHPCHLFIPSTSEVILNGILMPQQTVFAYNFKHTFPSILNVMSSLSNHSAYVKRSQIFVDVQIWATTHSSPVHYCPVFPIFGRPLTFRLQNKDLESLIEPCTLHLTTNRNVISKTPHQ